MTRLAPLPRSSIDSARRLHDDVVLQIVRQIMADVLPPGSTLPSEPVLAQRFGVSRTVIREAVRVLASKGLLSVKHGSGMRVQPSAAWDYLDQTILFEQVRAGRDLNLQHELIEVHRLLEVEAAGLAAVRRTPADVADLQEQLGRMAAVVDQPDTYTHLDVEFHACLVEAARNRLLREALRAVVHALAGGRLISMRQPGAIEQSWQDHQEIVRAVLEQNPELARATMRRHMLRFENDIYAAISMTDASVLSR